MTKKQGTLYGIGVGPGDPQLITVKAVDALRKVRVVFAAGSTTNGYSMAFDIVRDHLAPETEIRKLGFPMTQDQETLSDAWKKNAEAVLEFLNEGRDGAFITIGDPLTYSTYGYLMKTVKAIDPEVNVVTIPGITAYQAAAARLNLPLVEGQESLAVIPGTLPKEAIKELAGKADNAVILKAYRNFDQICEALEDLGLQKKAVLISRCGHDDELIDYGVSSCQGKKPHYMSLVVVKKNIPDVQ